MPAPLASPVDAVRPEPRIRTSGAHRPGFVVRALAEASGRAAGTEPSAVFMTLGRNRKLFWAWLRFAATMMPGGRLQRAQTELVIVRVAARTGNAYELQAHLRLAREAGVGEEELAAVQALGGTQAWSGRDRLLLDVADEMLRDRDLGDDTWQRLRASFDEATIIEIVMLVAHYEMLATTLRTLRVHPDATVAAHVDAAAEGVA